MKYHLGASSTDNSTKKKPMAGGYVEMTGGKYRVADPFFAEHLRQPGLRREKNWGFQGRN